MRQDPYLAQVFPQPPLVAYKRPANIKDKIVRAKVPDPTPTRPKRVVNGMNKCHKCPICSYMSKLGRLSNLPIVISGQKSTKEKIARPKI